MIIEIRLQMVTLDELSGLIIVNLKDVSLLVASDSCRKLTDRDHLTFTSDLEVLLSGE